MNSQDRLPARLTTPSLADLGWNPQRAAHYAAHAAAGTVPGRVARVDRGLCDVLLADPVDPNAATRTVRADWSAFNGPDPINNPCTGDWCVVDLGDPSAPVLRALLPRHTAVVRGATGERSDGQVLAANVDHVLITVSLAAKSDVGRIERLLALAWESGAQPVVVLTKADAGYDPERILDVEAAAPGATVLAVSALTGEGMDVLGALLAGGSAALIGQSGVGKSTLTNALVGAEVMATGGTRETDEKGRHTTTTRELIPLPGGGVLIDTPGLRGVGLFGGEAGLAQTFSDIEEFAEQCRFADCAHESEPGCAVLAAVADGELPERRLASYRKLLRENEWIASRTDARLAAERRQVWKQRSRDAAGAVRPDRHRR
ncbi:MAG TPA: ribosome small subunit-dependent GTPase A [Actinospica sp.]|nr:ribosome small subunit-dependent GTPase A [Actinospica sp.]